MIRLITFLAALAVGSGSFFADLSPRRVSHACEGDWQLGSDFRLGRLTTVVEDNRLSPGLLGGTLAGSLSVVTHDGARFSYGTVKTDGLHWYIYSEGEHMGMVSGTTGRILLETPRGLFRGTCMSL